MIDFVRKPRYGYDDLLEIIRLLRSPEGCPWDKMQTHESIRRGLLEEAYEAAEAIDTGDTALLKEELGFPAERLQYVYGAIRANKWIPVNMEVEHFLIENGINLDTRYTLLSRDNVIRLHEAKLQVNV